MLDIVTYSMINCEQSIVLLEEYEKHANEPSIIANMKKTKHQK